MKKLFLLVFGFCFFLHASASLKVRNHTCATIVFTVLCHDSNYPDCGTVVSQWYTISGVGNMSFSNTSSLGPCAIPPSYFGFPYTPLATQNWDKVAFLAFPGAVVGHGSYGEVDMACGGPTYWDSGEFEFCGHPNLGAVISTDGTNTYVDFNFY
jgi:hypothetical protein